mmetsp:Transcript_105636/g.308925  ORF Transcript_105636/g.308925 Transcript_105636/m.308925 type:complete len:414 (+) Transcript_105636:73-1314(+)
MQTPCRGGPARPPREGPGPRGGLEPRLVPAAGGRLLQQHRVDVLRGGLDALVHGHAELHGLRALPDPRVADGHPQAVCQLLGVRRVHALALHAGAHEGVQHAVPELVQPDGADDQRRARGPGRGQRAHAAVDDDHGAPGEEPDLRRLLHEEDVAPGVVHEAQAVVAVDQGLEELHAQLRPALEDDAPHVRPLERGDGQGDHPLPAAGADAAAPADVGRGVPGGDEVLDLAHELGAAEHVAAGRARLVLVAHDPEAGVVVLGDLPPAGVAHELEEALRGDGGQEPDEVPLGEPPPEPVGAHVPDGMDPEAGLHEELLKDDLPDPRAGIRRGLLHVEVLSRFRKGRIRLALGIDRLEKGVDLVRDPLGVGVREADAVRLEVETDGRNATIRLRRECKGVPEDVVQDDIRRLCLQL